MNMPYLERSKSVRADSNLWVYSKPYVRTEMRLLSVYTIRLIIQLFWQSEVTQPSVQIIRVANYVRSNSNSRNYPKRYIRHPVSTYMVRLIITILAILNNPTQCSEEQCELKKKNIFWSTQHLYSPSVRSTSFLNTLSSVCLLIKV